MAKDYLYLDKIVKDKIGEHTIETDVTWDEFNKKLSDSNGGIDLPNPGKGMSGFFSLKNILFGFAILSILSVLIIRYANNVYNTDSDLLLRSKSKNLSLPITVKPVLPIENLTEKNSSVNIKKEDNIIIKKQVIIKDTVYL